MFGLGYVIGALLESFTDEIVEDEDMPYARVTAWLDFFGSF